MKVFTIGKPSLKELYELSKDTTISVSSTPFGADLNRGEKQVYMKKAVPWKGVKGIENLRKVNPKVASTVEKLANASRMISGEFAKGTVICNYRGKLTMMPKKAFLMAKAANKPIELVSETAPVFRMNIDTFVSRAAEVAEKYGKYVPAEIAPTLRART